jgi:hypothetical protein
MKTLSDLDEGLTKTRVHEWGNLSKLSEAQLDAIERSANEDDRIFQRWRRQLPPQQDGFHLAWALRAGFGRHIKERSERERFLSLFGPISMVGDYRKPNFL